MRRLLLKQRWDNPDKNASVQNFSADNEPLPSKPLGTPQELYRPARTELEDVSAAESENFGEGATLIVHSSEKPFDFFL